MIAVFWTDRKGLRQMEAGWRDCSYAQRFIAMQRAQHNVRPETVVFRYYAGMCPW